MVLFLYRYYYYIYVIWIVGFIKVGGLNGLIDRYSYSISSNTLFSNTVNKFRLDDKIVVLLESKKFFLVLWSPT